MKMRFLHIAAMLLLLFSTNSLPAQKHISNYDPNALYEQGLILFQHEEYGAALESFSKYLDAVEDKKLQKAVDAQYYVAVSALYSGQSDAEAKIMAFVNDNPGSTWARHANFLYANVLFGRKKYQDALALYNQTSPSSLTQNEAQQMQFNMGYAYFQLNELDKALPILQGAALNEGKYQQDAKYYYAYIQYLKGNDLEALRYFEQLRNQPVYAKVVPAYIMQINYRHGNYQAVLADGPDAVRNADKSRQGEMALMVADAYFQQKDYDNALVYYTYYTKSGSVRNMPREVCYQMGVCKMKTDNLKGAIADLQKVASDKDTLGQYASYYLASCYADTDQPKFARNAFYTAYSAGFDKTISEDALFNYAYLSLTPGADPFNEAVAQLDAFVAEQPKSKRKAEAEELAVYLLLNTKNNDQALARLEKMRKKSPELRAAYDELLFSTGVDHFQNQRFDKAQSCFSKILKGNQTGRRKAEATFWLAESAYAAQDYSTAQRYFKQVKNSVSSSPELLNMADYGLGYINYQKADYDEAVANFRSFVQRCDDRQSDLKSDAYIRLGDCFFVDRSYDQAINYYDLATRINKRNADYAIFQQGLCYGAKGNANKKIAMLDDMMRTYPSTNYYDKALFEIGNTHLVYGDKRSAIAAFNRLIKERPRSSYTRQALMKVGMIYYNNNQYDQALTNLKTLVQAYPNTDESREAMSIIRNIYMEQNNLNAYFGYVESSGSGQIQVTQQDSLAFANAENFYLEGRYQDAEKALKYYFDHFQRGAYALKAHYYASECAEKVGTEEEVKSHLNYIVSQPLNDYTDNALLKLARIEYDHSNYEKAGQYYGRLASITEEPLRKLEALEGGMKSNFFMENYDKAIEMGESLSNSKDLTTEQVNQINHIVGKSYVMKGNYATAMTWLDKSVRADRSVYGAESAYYSAMASFKTNNLDEAETKVFDISDKFASHEYWVAKSFILLADVYVAKDNEFQAKETLRSVIDNCSIQELKNEAQHRLDHIKE
ncbi:MAG: tetratricopeptide repeat protein [Bacteroidales bacterium]|nr:tetratricopeptide repeat protein [Bacteroidales bacterium]